MQSSIHYREFPDSGTVILAKVTAIKNHQATSVVEKLWGDGKVTVVKSAEGNSVVMEDTALKVGEKIESNIEPEPSFDDEGNPLVLVKIKGELDESQIKAGTQYLLVYPDKFFPYKKDSDLVKFIEKTRSSGK